jgi:hypothetical protein
MSYGPAQEELMELHMHSHRWVARQADWTAAAIAGFGAGGILMLMEVAWAAIRGGDAFLTTRMVAAMVMGWEVLQTPGYSLGILIAALAVHYVLGITFALMLAGLIAPFHLDSSHAMVVVTGMAFGVLLYVLNFYGMSGAFSWFSEIRGWPTLIGHMVFGGAAALFYRLLERPGKPE